MNKEDTITGTLYSPQVDAASYEKAALHPLRIASITEQLRLISQLGRHNILEIGVGKGLIRHFLKCFTEIKHTCIDIAADLNPDFVGSVLNMPFKHCQFDCVLCCQVLEHLKFEDFSAALHEIHRVSQDIVILSLPDKRRIFGFGVCLFRFGWHKLEFNLESSKARNGKISTQHYWEIGHSKATSGTNVIKAIRSAGFRIENTYRLEKFPWHCFFILKRL